MSVLCIRSHAKINLELRVLGGRPDGFHELRTVFQTIALHDVLTFDRVSGPFAIACATPGVPCDATNLVWRAAEALWRALDRAGALRDVRVHIDKQIPPQAGLAGGSSNAAATLLALADLWEARLPADRMQALAAGLGADVPFFLTGGTALGLGRGDQVHALPDAPPAWVVLLLPAFGVSTAEAFGWLRADAGAPEGTVGGERTTINDLEGPVSRRHPQIRTLVDALRHAGAHVAGMSGSGSTVFGLFDSQEVAAAVADRLRGRGLRALVARTVQRGRYRRRMRPVVRRR